MGGQRGRRRGGEAETGRDGCVLLHGYTVARGVCADPGGVCLGLIGLEGWQGADVKAPSLPVRAQTPQPSHLRASLHAGTGQDSKRVKVEEAEPPQLSPMEGWPGDVDAINGGGLQVRIAKLEAEVTKLRYRARGRARARGARARGGVAGGGMGRRLPRCEPGKAGTGRRLVP